MVSAEVTEWGERTVTSVTGPPCAKGGSDARGVLVNDVHSRINATRVHRIARPACPDEICAVLRHAKEEGRPVSIAGGCHAMGGQQFGSGTVLLDTAAMNRVLSFDAHAGLIEVEAGIKWPELLTYLAGVQDTNRPHWGIRQKQTGADRLCIGGALSANAHGRGLRFPPIIGDVESFTLVDAAGELRVCNRERNSELFRLAIGGYGLFGVIATVTLRLVPRQKVERVVRILDLEELIPAVENRTAAGFLYGDFQFAIDPCSGDFLRKGVFSCYRPLDAASAMPKQQRELGPEDWMRLFHLAHTDKRQAFERYAAYYGSTDGQRYWSDTHQLSEYTDDYHQHIETLLGPSGEGSEMITEVYVPRAALVAFMRDAGRDLRASGADVIYGTIRFVEQDRESFLAWAGQRYVCIIFNLHTAHTRAALDKTAGDFRRLIERAIQYRGSYYLTYHRWATRRQLLACYPQFVEFLKLKLRYDHDEHFQSDWYRHYRNMFADALDA